MNRKKKISIIIGAFSVFIIVSALLSIFISSGKKNDNKNLNNSTSNIEEVIIKYSTLDNKIFFDKYSNEIVKVSLVDDESILYENSTVMVDDSLKNTESFDLTDYTKKVNVVLSDGSLLKGTFVSYTKVLTKADDLSIFSHVSKSDILKGYFIVENDIFIANTSWTGNIHYKDWDINGIFNGVFDGDGHVVELKLKYGGLFGIMGENSVVKDVAFIVKQMDTTGPNHGNVIAFNSIATYSSDKPLLQDVYVKWDLPTGTVLNTSYNTYGQDFGLALFGKQPYYSRFSNVIVDMSGIIKQTENMDFRYGVLYSRTHPLSSATWCNSSLSNIYVINKDKFFALDHEYNGNTVLDQYVAVQFASNDISALEEFMLENPTAINSYCYSGVKRYDSLVAFANDSSNNNFDSFNIDIWDFSKGCPIFKSLINCY